MAKYADRTDAGHRLAERLTAYRDRRDVVVLGLPRGGLVTAHAVAEDLHAELDVFCVRKLGVPWHEELAMGAVASGGVRVINEDVVAQLHIPEEDIEKVADAERIELARRERAYRGDRPPADLTDKIVILVDDGIATGATARAAIAAIKRSEPARIVLAVPVGPEHTFDDFNSLVDEIACPLTPRGFDAVGRWYMDFHPTTDDEVRDLLTLR